MTFYELLTELCYMRGVSPSKMCKEIGLSNATASQWKKGAMPSQKTIKLIAEYFNMDTTELLGRLKVIEAIDAVQELQDRENKMTDYDIKQMKDKTTLLKAYSCADENIKKAINILLEIDIDIQPIIYGNSKGK